jgi:hypothetical protein
VIRDHVYRPLVPRRKGVPTSEQPCQFMNCLRPIAEHERAVSGWRR